MNVRTGLQRRALLALGAFALAGCASSKDGKRATPEVAVNAAWLHPVGRGAVDATWWTVFGDDTLSQSIAQALDRNLDIRSAATRLAEVEALRAAQAGSILPAISFGAGATRGRAVSAATGQPQTSTGWEAQFRASYEVDLWGKVAAESQAAQADEVSARLAGQAVSLGVAATTAAQHVQLLLLDAQLDLARRTRASRQRSFELTVSRERAGYGSRLESAQAEAELRGTDRVVPSYELAIERQERMLNLLRAESPTPIQRGMSLEALTQPPMPAAGLPSTLLARRPDIAAATEQLAAADARFEAARARLLPSLRITATLGQTGSNILRGDPFGIWSIGGSLLAPIFNGGELRALSDMARSRRGQALIVYERAVLTAFAEVEDQLATLASTVEQRVHIDLELRATERSLQIATHRHAAGHASYLDELLAQRNLFAVQQEMLRLRAQHLQATIALYRALGGGWSAA